jgi:hypothetical protein
MMQRFICFIRGGLPNPEQQEDDLQRLKHWISKLTSDGIILDSGILTNIGKISKVNSESIKDFVFDRNDNASSFIIIQAKTIEQAIELTKDCPIFLYKGNLTIRPIEEIPH